MFTLTDIINYGTTGDNHLAGEARFSDGKRYRFVISRPLLYNPLRFGKPCVSKMATPYIGANTGPGAPQWAWRKKGAIFPKRAALIMVAYPEYLAKAKVEKEREDAAEAAQRKVEGDAYRRDKALKEAAPDLLVALQSVTRAYGAADGRNGNSGECWDLARAAITKATTIPTS